LQYWVCKGTFIPNGVIVGKNEEKRTVDVGETSVSIGVITEHAGILELIKYPQIYTNSGIWLVQLIEELWKLKNKIAENVDIIAIGIGERICRF